MKNIISILDTLKNFGYKLTPHRKTIVEYIERVDGLFSAYQVAQQFKNIDQASVYRTFALLQELDIIHSIGELDGQQYFELHEKKGKHHHHIICTNCKNTKCVDCCIKIKEVSGFMVDHHSFLLTGLCTPCHQKS
jgi:Fur family zinc uptake transcriptional regulator